MSISVNTPEKSPLSPELQAYVETCVMVIETCCKTRLDLELVLMIKDLVRIAFTQGRIDAIDTMIARAAIASPESTISFTPFEYPPV